VFHDPTWPPIPTKFPSDIMKFEGKNDKDPGDHVTTFHQWCSLNSLNEDSIRLRLFQCTLIRVAAKWYIELPRGAYGTFIQMVLVFLNHFQLLVRYDADLEILSTLCQDTATHILDHIQEWSRHKGFIKTSIPPNFILEWFLKSFHPSISKDVATSGVTTEEESIFKAQQLDLIYAQFGMLYHILPDAPMSTYDPRQNLGPHADNIVGSTNVKSADSVTSHLKEFSLNEFARGTTSSIYSNTTQSMNVRFMQSSTDPNGNQQPGGNKKKGCNNNRKGGKNKNKPKDNGNNEKTNKNKICMDDHLTHLCPKLAEIVILLSLPPVMLTNPFPHNQHMASSSSNVENASGGIQNPLSQDNDRLCINMINYQVNVATLSHDYSSSQAILGLESPPPPSEMTL
jgi:hypothetical protein